MFLKGGQVSISASSRGRSPGSHTVLLMVVPAHEIFLHESNMALLLVTHSALMLGIKGNDLERKGETNAGSEELFQMWWGHDVEP